MKGQSKQGCNSKPLINFLKIISVLFFSTVFGYWSEKAIEKFLAKPISTTVSYSIGDDGHGNIGNKFKVTKLLYTFN